MVVRVVDPQDVQSAGIALINQPPEIVEVMDQPEARNTQGDGCVGARHLEPSEKRPVERPFAGAEIAGEEIARRRPMGQPGILQKTAMDETRRLGQFADRAAHAGRLEFGLAHFAAGPARRALEPGGQSFRIGEQGELLASDSHLADRHRLAAVGGDACLQHWPIVADHSRALEPSGRRWREGAVGPRGAGEARPGGEHHKEKAREGGQKRDVHSGLLLTKEGARC